MGKDRDPGDQVKHQTPSRPMSPNSQRDPKLQAARVRLPDGRYKEFDLNRGSEGSELFRLLTLDLSIEEREYFSLCFYDTTEGARHWLYNDKKILRQLKGLPWEFSFEVKFYPTTPSTLVDDHARYYLFLQLRRDILTGRLPATNETHALLGAFVAQIEFNDSPKTMTDDYEKFIVQSKLVPDSVASPEVYAQIAKLHTELRGLTTSEAENQYLDHCKELALYGIHLYPAKDKKNSDVNIGIGALGVNIYENESVSNSFRWANIIKIGYRKNTFTIKLKAGQLGDKEATAVYKLVDYQHAKRVWKCAVEHHTFFRLIQPDDKPNKGLFNFGSHRFRYHGRTQFQTKMASQMFDKPTHVDRSPSAMSQPINAAVAEQHRLHYTDSELEQQTLERDKSKKKDKKGKKENDSSETSDSEHDEKREFAVVQFQSESGQPYTTVSTWQETNALPEQVEVYTDENGRQITRTIKSSQVKHTVQTQSFQNYIVDGDQVPVGVVDVERSREQLTPLGQQGSSNGDGIVETQTRTMTYEAQSGENAAPPGWAEQGLGEYVSSKSVTQGNRTIETITYKTEKDGIIETHVEHRVTIHSDGDIDHDAELSQAIMEATQMNPDMVVEKIEVRQESTQ